MAVCWIELAVVSSAAYLLVEGEIEREVAIVVGHPAAGMLTEAVGDDIQGLGLGEGTHAARTTPDDEGWPNWGRNASCSNPTQDRFT